MRSRYLFSLTVVGAAFMLAPGAAGAESDALRAYNACAVQNNKIFRGLAVNKAIVAGVDGERHDCFYQYGKATVNEAQNDTMAECHQYYTNCYVFATNGVLQPWVQQIVNRLRGQ